MVSSADNQMTIGIHQMHKPIWQDEHRAQEAMNYMARVGDDMI
jgi:hypothetical protein